MAAEKKNSLSLWERVGVRVYPAHHYMLPALRRLPEVRRLIDQQGYFVVHAPQQTGKTTAMRALADELNAESRHVCVHLSMKVGAPHRDIGADPLCREILVRALSSGTRDTLPSIHPSWLRQDGRLDFERLRDAFLAFWRQHGEPLLLTAPYHEIAPHRVLMAFLHRVVNGGGSIEREYAIGRGRMDLCVRHGPDTLGIEIKVWRDKEPDPLAEGLVQLDGSLEGLGLESGWLVLFDRRGGQPPLAARTRAEQATTHSGRAVTVIRG